MSRQRVYLLAQAVWLVFLVLAFGLGVVRERLLAPAIGGHAAHVVGTLVFVGVMLGVTAAFVRRIRPRCTPADLWLVGLLWVALTAAFEFLFFHFVAGESWEVMLAHYDLLRGRIWVLVPLAELFGPPLLGSGLLRYRPPRRVAGR
jgi:hypothetical protein